MILCEHGHEATTCRGCGWVQVQARAVRYWETHDAEGNPREYHPVRSSYCADRAHRVCRGYAAGHVPCGCECHSRVGAR